jgi:hypothetical protein
MFAFCCHAASGPSGEISGIVDALISVSGTAPAAGVLLLSREQLPEAGANPLTQSMPLGVIPRVSGENNA